jgi:hypothetical protein
MGAKAQGNLLVLPGGGEGHDSTFTPLLLVKLKLLSADFFVLSRQLIGSHLLSIYLEVDF